MAKYVVSEYARKNGLAKEDAKHDLVIAVRKTDVTHGKKKDAEQCALARAVLAQIPESKRVWIFRSTAHVETARRMVRYNLPQSVQREVEAFDRFGVMEPGVYKLSAPSPAKTKKGAKKYNETMKARRKKQRISREARNAAPKKPRLAGKFRTGVKETSE